MSNEMYESKAFLLKITHKAPDWLRWIAQDKSGAWWGYSVEPLRSFNGWYENEVGECVLLLEAETEADGWKNSLQQIKALVG